MIGGYIGNASVIVDNCTAVTGQHSAVLPMGVGSLVDSRFLLAYLNSYYAEKIFSRYVSGTVQAGINLEDLRELPAPIADNLVQKYIGDKVRQAERLRAWAKKSEDQANTLFNEVTEWKSECLNVPNHGYILPSELSGRLDLKYNSPQRLAILRHTNRHGIKLEELSSLVEISAMIGWKGLTTDHYKDFGPWLLRGVEFKNGVISTEELVCVDEDKYQEQPQIHLIKDDIAFSKDGTLGKAIVIPELTNRLAAGSTIARLRIRESQNINPYYLEYVLSHEILQVQIMSFATGIAQPHITQEWIAQLSIPRVSGESDIADYWFNHHLCLNIAKQLTTSAKLLVEGLIEGLVTEAELIAAQQGLEAGDTEADAAILRRLKTDGLDGKGQPLFGDVERVYELLGQASNESQSA